MRLRSKWSLFTLIVLAFALPVCLAAQAPARLREAGPRFDLRDIPDATAAFEAMSRAPLAPGPRQRLAAVYQREGLRSAAEFYAATITLIEEQEVGSGESLTGQTWRCPAVDVAELVSRVREALDEGDLAEGSAIARRFYDENGNACEGAIFWAWCEVLWNSPAPDLAKKELAIRALITRTEDGMRFPETILPDDSYVYFNLAHSFAALDDPISAAVAARRAEIRSQSPAIEMNEATLAVLEILQKEALDRLQSK